METVKLQLFKQDFEANPLVEETNTSTVTEERIVTSLVEVLNAATPAPGIGFDHVTQKIGKSLDDLFPEQQRDEKEIRHAKETLGILASDLSQNELKDVIVEIQYLAESWLDDFERDVFKGKTLKELLHEKGRL